MLTSRLDNFAPSFDWERVQSCKICKKKQRLYSKDTILEFGAGFQVLSLFTSQLRTTKCTSLPTVLVTVPDGTIYYDMGSQHLMKLEK